RKIKAVNGHVNKNPKPEARNPKECRSPNKPTPSHQQPANSRRFRNSEFGFEIIISVYPATMRVSRPPLTNPPAFHPLRASVCRPTALIRRLLSALPVFCRPPSARWQPAPPVLAG